MKKLLNNWNKLDPFIKEKLGEMIGMFLLGCFVTYMTISQK